MRMTAAAESLTARRKCLAVDRQEISSSYLVAPDTSAYGLTKRVSGIAHDGVATELRVVEERPLTIFVNGSEIVTAMTIGDYPELLALGFLFNQGLLKSYSEVERVDFDEELETVVVRTKAKTDYERKLGKKIRTSGCAMGTVFGDMYEMVQGRSLPDVKIRTSWMYRLAHLINRTPSLYLEAGAIHGTVLCRRDQPLVYMEDVGRHNAVDKVAGWMMAEGVRADDKLLYTTGRLTSEMVLKTAMMGVPALVSRSGFTAWGVELAREIGLTLVGRMRGKRYFCLSGAHRLVRDADPDQVPHEDRKHRRKSADGER